MSITPKTKLCMVIGDPVEHSLGPQMHNAAYQELGIDSDYVYVACKVQVSDIPDFIKGVRAMGIRGVSCTIPHKTAVMEYLDTLDPVAEKIGAVNTIVNDDGVLRGYNTDWLGAVVPLEQIGPLKNKKVALIGAGGAAKAIAYGVMQRGALLTVYNRTQSKAEALASEFGAAVGSLDSPSDITRDDIIINATSVGMAPHQDESPLEKQYITAEHIVFDVVYSPYETKLLKDAKEQGAQVIHGSEMLLQQGVAQFKLYTGYDAPENVMRSALRKALGIGEE